MEEVVITGMGCVSALGNSPEILWDNLLQGESGVAVIDRFDSSALPIRIAAAVREFDGSEYFSARDQSRFSKCIQYAVYSACQALNNAGIDPKAEDPSRSGVIIGAGIGGMNVYSDGIIPVTCATGVAVDKRKLSLDEPIKALGSYPIKLKLGYDVTAAITLRVVEAGE